MKPIIFNSEMVRAILDGGKTQTRRIINFKKLSDIKKGRLFYSSSFKSWAIEGGECHLELVKCPYGTPGDLLYVRETHYLYGHWVKNGKSKTGKQKWTFRPHLVKACYSDNPPVNVHPNKYRLVGWYKRPSIFMPRSASRLTLRVKNVRVERVRDITEEGAVAEGIYFKGCPDLDPDWPDTFGNPRGPVNCVCYPNCECGKSVLRKFKNLWNSINEKRGFGWEKNPWVWVVEFEKN